MSKKFPVIAITGSSGAGTTTVKKSFQHIFRREMINAHIIEGDSFHRYNRIEMREKMAAAEKAGHKHLSHFGPEANLLEELSDLFAGYSNNGTGRSRLYLHDDVEAAPFGQEQGTFTPWEEIPHGTDLLFYEGLHGGYADERTNVAENVDLSLALSLLSISNGFKSSTEIKHHVDIQRKQLLKPFFAECPIM